MKTNYLSFFLLLGILLNGNSLFAQSTEDFESEATSGTTFTDSGQNFTITNGAGESTYDIEFFSNGGWNGTAVDNKFIDNSSGTPTQNDGTSFIITTTDGTDITIKSLYIFVSTRALANPSSTLTIVGKKDGEVTPVFTITKNSGFSNVETFSPNNGFTLIDFSTEGGIDNSDKNVDELIISATANGDYLALDALTWGAEVLSTNNFEFEQNKAKIFPNPSSDRITVSGLKKDENYKIYNVLGTEIIDGIIANNKKIDIKNLTSGMYFLKFENGNSIKFLKE
ncbi:T9SS type A sorting domain-containing protein [Sabulilitoribacter arenilitoris]|uniref:T9SS type A sorting domain-containing protein n=1 Tax=Wocania arenilitoris TaxID=2044858 RepID=A0AAE3EQD8_9FLAO|nr:T9SS type A sorting domain-containing protein [Wocania arenilitoris]MCF7569671.1 T9SS type A sorting domain-containing protein [Wocania arenilitoris]